jgi:hypothetical protein
MILGRKKFEATLPSPNNALRHLNRLNFRLCHINALSFVPLTSPYRDYAIALLPASSGLVDLTGNSHQCSALYSHLGQRMQ